jgi:F0F1-type ATP synthase epsilon subunit
VADSLRLVAWTPGETLVEATKVEWVHVELSGNKGLTIWPGHAPMLGQTAAEPLRYADPSGTHLVDLPPGVLQVRDDTVTIFLASTIDDPVWKWTGEDGERFERLAETLLAVRRTDGS